MQAAPVDQPIDAWNTSAVTVMKGRLGQAAALGQPMVDLNTSGVTIVKGQIPLHCGVQPADW